MRIMKNQSILQKQSDNYIRGELSNVAAAISTPQIIVRYYRIDANLSTTMTGLHNVEDYIGERSPVQYDVISNLPMAGIDNLVSQSTFDDELGFDEDFSSSGMILPNTIAPKPNDFFQVIGSDVTALYVVTNKNQVTVRSNPFVEIQFRLYSRDPEVIKQLERQVKNEYLVTVTAIGEDKTMVIKKKSFFEIQDHVKQYLDLLELYRTYFYDENKSAFVFDGLPGIDGEGCLGYITKNDILDGTDGGWREEFGDPENPHYATIQQMVQTDLKNGVTVNERGDKFYIVDGDPVIVPGYVPYWFVRNHVDSKSITGASITDIPCKSCCNKNCDNMGCAAAWNNMINSAAAQGKMVIRQVFIDMTLWKLLFDEGIVIFDDIVTYAQNNFNSVNHRIYTDCPDLYIDEHFYRRSVLYRLLTHDMKHDPFEFCHPTCTEGDPRITKFQGKNIFYLEHYDRTRDCNLNIGYYNIWDEEFQWRIKNCKPYPIGDIPVTMSNESNYGSCKSYPAQYYYPFNRSLRNAIIYGYNRRPIDWDELEVTSERSIENYTLIPLVMSYYKEYIRSLQK